MENLIISIQLSQLRIAFLKKRLYLISEDRAIKSEYEKNEIDLKRVETIMEIGKQRTILERDLKKIREEFKITNDSKT